MESTISILESLVSFDTESSKSNLPLIKWVEGYLVQYNVPFVKQMNEAGDKASLFATIGPVKDDGIILSGHVDVVSVAGQAWTSDPFVLRRHEGRLYGRGACDMKGFDAIALAMVPYFQSAGLAAPIHILLSYDEETTCLGPVALIERFGHDLPRPRAVIVGEPTQMQVADAHKGVATFMTHVHGVEAHSAKPALGVNAVQIACELVSGLYKLDDDYALAGDPTGRFDPPRSTLHVGTIKGGTARNILAKDCAFQWEFRGVPGMTPQEALQCFNAMAERVAGPKLAAFSPQARVETHIEIDVPGLAPEPGSLAETLALRLTRSNHTLAVPFATEAGRFQAAGVPTIVCGPGSIDQAHQPDEYIEESEIRAGIKFMKRLAEELQQS